MTSSYAIRWERALRRHPRTVVISGFWIGVVLLVTLGTKVVGANSSTAAAGSPVFSATEWAKREFPKIQAAVSGRAIPIAKFAAAVKNDPANAVRKYGVTVQGGIAPIVSVTFSGVAGTPTSGDYPLKVPGLPSGITVLIQTGPAIINTNLRDATGTITFGQFVDQIAYQNAASALNEELKRSVLSRLNVGHLTGKTLTGVGVFAYTDPHNWLITPVKLSAS